MLEFSILVMSDDLVPAVKEWLSYRKLRGLGQWRNSGKEDSFVRFWRKERRNFRTF